MQLTDSQIASLEAELNALNNPTTAEVLAHSQDYEAAIVAALAARIAMAGGAATLAQVLAEGGDPDGNPITGALAIVDQEGNTTALDIFSAALTGDDQIVLVVGADEGNLFQVHSGGNTLHTLYDDTSNVEIKRGSTVIFGVYGNSQVGFFGESSGQPVVPLTSPTVQNVIDALVALGLVAQHD